jgi:ribosome biogenesis GTPase / thiamine phosphate phosphatase
MDLSLLGWDPAFSAAFESMFPAGLVPARVACEHKQAYDLYSASGDLAAVCSGRLLHESPSRADLPAVGDWVAVAPLPGEARAVIHGVLPRRTVFSRLAAGPRPEEQVVAANIDVVLLVMGLDANYNPRRLERFLAVAWQSGAQPVVVLNKADVHPAPDDARREISHLARGAPVVVVSALSGEGLAGLEPHLRRGATVAALGSSGVGKSTLINALLGLGRQDTGPAREHDARGRHTTTRRELIAAPGGFFLMDTPGMRELQIAADGADLDETFGDLRRLAGRCRFSDCTHRAEPGCAVRVARETGELDEGRWIAYQKLLREEAHAQAKADETVARRERASWKRIHLGARAHRRWQTRNDLE